MELKWLTLLTQQIWPASWHSSHSDCTSPTACWKRHACSSRWASWEDWDPFGDCLSSPDWSEMSGRCQVSLNWWPDWCNPCHLYGRKAVNVLVWLTTPQNSCFDQWIPLTFMITRSRLLINIFEIALRNILAQSIITNINNGSTGMSIPLLISVTFPEKSQIWYSLIEQGLKCGYLKIWFSTCNTQIWRLLPSLNNRFILASRWHNMAICICRSVLSSSSISAHYTTQNKQTSMRICILHHKTNTTNTVLHWHLWK